MLVGTSVTVRYEGHPVGGDSGDCWTVSWREVCTKSTPPLTPPTYPFPPKNNLDDYFLNLSNYQNIQVCSNHSNLKSDNLWEDPNGSCAF